jgi:hypothetical protein
MGKHCAAVELLLARMDSNPEEFVNGGRWDKLIDRYKSILPATDRAALEGKLNSLYLEVFHRDVMKELLEEPKKQTLEEHEKQTVDTVWAGGNTVSSYTNAVANINLSQQSIKDIAAAMGQYAKRSV